jgi:arylsulfatase
LENYFSEMKSNEIKTKKNEAMKTMKTNLIRTALLLVALITSIASSFAQSSTPATGKKPNILVIMGDDIGWYNPSIYNRGDMGYWTPNIDRIGKEGAMFTCWYGQQSCTAGRAAFITGQSPIRPGLTKVGLPGAPQGIQPRKSCGRISGRYR